MKNKAIDSFENFQKFQLEGMLEARLKYFEEKYAPEDPRLQAEFFADFSMIVRQIHISASEPFVKHISNIMCGIPFPSLQRKEGE